MGETVTVCACTGGKIQKPARITPITFLRIRPLRPLRKKSNASPVWSDRTTDPDENARARLTKESVLANLPEAYVEVLLFAIVPRATHCYPYELMLRVRFAPSPTGYLHIGSARTFIFNWLYARHNHGVMILRIDDTDFERNTQASLDSIFEGLKWLDLGWG